MAAIVLTVKEYILFSIVNNINVQKCRVTRTSIIVARILEFNCMVQLQGNFYKVRTLNKFRKAIR